MAMLDLEALRREAEGDGMDLVPVTRRWLAQAHRELAAGRARRARRAIVPATAAGAGA